VQAGLLGGDLGAAGAEEGLDLVAVVHAVQARSESRDEGWAVSTPPSSDFSAPPAPGCMVLAVPDTGRVIAWDYRN
jgi:hypothetical protein